MAINSGLRAADGSFRVTVLSASSASTLTGLYAADGSINVVSSTGGTWVGIHHPCGAWWVTLNTGTSPSFAGYLAADGSVNVSQTTYVPSTQWITVVGGTFITTTGSPPQVAVFQGRF